MTGDSRILIALAGGGDERVSASSLSYIRRVLDFEAETEPEGASAVALGRLKLISKTSPSDLAAQFAAQVPVVTLTLRDNSLAYVHGAVVVDVDDAPSTLPGARSWLVFGVGPAAPRLPVRQSREQLRNTWSDAGLDPDASGI